MPCGPDSPRARSRTGNEWPPWPASSTPIPPRAAPRRPHDVIAPPEGRSTLARTPRSGPRAHRKWLTASLVHPPEQVIAAAFDQAAARDRDHLRDWVVLVDGARHQLGLIQAEADRRGIKVHILLDFVHVSEYIWDAAHCFHKPGTAAAEAWVAGHLTTILHGQAARAATEITAQADRAGLHGTRREGVDACVRYLTGHLGQLRYDTALAAGWPIATGAIEGACRHIVGDRLDITGSRWGLKGAEAILKLRALKDNGRLQHLLGVPPHPRAQTPLPHPRPTQLQPHGLIRNVPTGEPHPRPTASHSPTGDYEAACATIARPPATAASASAGCALSPEVGHQ